MKKELIAHFNPKSPVSEMFRTLRTNIQFMSSDKELKTLLVTSTAPGEGKSWTSSNLAVTFAQAGQRVVLVDADMRKGRQFNIFGISPRPGLSNYLSGIIGDTNGKDKDDLSNYIQQTEVNNLFVMPAGDVPPNPSELLVSSKMRRLVKELREVCDVIILDAPPSLVVTDANILARIADSTIIVVAQNETKYDSLEKVKKSIEKVGGKIAGVVLNKVPVDPKKYENSYYYGSTTPLSASRKSNMSKKEMTQIEIERRSRENKDRMINILDSDKRTPTRVNDVDNDILSQMNEYLEQEKRRLKSDGE